MILNGPIKNIINYEQERDRRTVHEANVKAKSTSIHLASPLLDGFRIEIIATLILICMMWYSHTFCVSPPDSEILLKEFHNIGIINKSGGA